MGKTPISKFKIYKNTFNDIDVSAFFFKRGLEKSIKLFVRLIVKILQSIKSYLLANYSH